MAIESDRAQVLSGVRHGADDRRSDRAADSEQGLGELAADDGRRGASRRPDATGVDRPLVTRPRPGHADLAGVVKYGHDDIRNVLERASARETAARVAVGAIARQLLAPGRRRDRQPRRVDRIGGAAPIRWRSPSRTRARSATTRRCTASTPTSSADDRGDRSRPARPATRWAAASRSSRTACRPGLGSHVQWDRKLDGRLAQALMSIPAIKAVGIGRGPGVAALPGSRIHDEILAVGSGAATATGVRRAADQQRRRPRRRHHQRRGPAGHRLHETDRHADEAAALGRSRPRWPISPAAIERSDVCAVPAAAVVGEAMVAIVLADALAREVRRRLDRRSCSRTGARSERPRDSAARVSRTRRPASRFAPR